MKRLNLIMIPFLFIGLTLSADTKKETPQQALAEGQLNMLTQADQVLRTAFQAGAEQSATDLYEDAKARLDFARDHWGASDMKTRDLARMRAEEALWAGRAALAKARWIGTNNVITGLQTDIRHFGGTSEDIAIVNEPATISRDWGTDSNAHVRYAQSLIDQAKAAGAESIAGNDIRPAEENLKTAREILRAERNNAIADHLAYVAEMMARRSYYMTRFNAVDPYIGKLQLSRTRYAQQETERRAAAERAQRQAAEQQAAQLRQQLATEQANRQAQADELARLRDQLRASREALRARIEADHAARLSAEQTLDQAMARYQAAVNTGNSAEVEALRRQVEDEQLSLRTVQERERLNEQMMSAEVEGMKAQSQGITDASLLSKQQADLAATQAQLAQRRKDREQDLARRAESEKRMQAAIDEANRRRADAEAQAQSLQQQTVAAQQAAQSAQQAAQAAQQTAQAAQAAAQATQQQLDKRESESRLQSNLARIATTRRDTRGLIVTLTGEILFDTGKTALKPGAKATLRRIAAELKNDPNMKVTIEGHTDNTGGVELNDRLSRERAEAVRAYLIDEGVAAGKLTAVGRGEGEPVASNKTAAGRLQNRRVELVITE